MTFYNELKKICPQTIKDEPMSSHTSFKIGGNADYFSTPKNIEELKRIIAFCKKNNLSYFILGNGSNTLVSDYGIGGIVIDISKGFSYISIDEKKIIAGAGTLLSKIASEACKNSLSGLEFAAGIPGSVGGAIYMNAGAYGGEIKDVITNVTYLDESGNLEKLAADKLDFGYRKSFFSGKKFVIIEAEFDLNKSNSIKIREKMNELNKKRAEKQPINMPSAGSVFKRPEGHFAAALIEQAGLKGYSVGDAQVSDKHAGFIINKGKASAQDVIELVKYIQQKVFDKFSVMLEPEIKLIGRDEESKWSSLQ